MRYDYPVRVVLTRRKVAGVDQPPQFVDDVGNVRADNADDLMAAAKKAVTARGFHVRSVSIGQEQVVVNVYHRDEPRPGPTPDVNDPDARALGSSGRRAPRGV